MFRTAVFVALCFTSLHAMAACHHREPQAAVQQSAAAMLNSKAFAELDAAAARYRVKDRFSAAGNLTLDAFYDTLTAPVPDCDGSQAAPSVWTEREARLLAWITASPYSSSARIAHAAFVTRFGNLERANGFASPAAGAGSPAFVKRMAQARMELEAIAASERDDPWWYRAMLDVGLAQGWSVPEFERLLEQGITRFPQAYRLYYAGADFHSAKGQGSDAALVAYIERMAGKTKKTMGPLIYTKLRNHAESNRLFKDENKGNWALMKAGHERILKQYPDKFNRVIFADDACGREDIPVLRQQLKLLGADKDSPAWSSPNRAAYCAQRQFGPATCMKRDDSDETVCYPTPKK